MPSPVVGAAGREELAREMTRTALRYGVPIVEEPELSTRLSRQALGASVDPALYEDIARLFVQCGAKSARRTEEGSAAAVDTGSESGWCLERLPRTFRRI